MRIAFEGADPGCLSPSRAAPVRRVQPIGMQIDAGPLECLVCRGQADVLAQVIGDGRIAHGRMAHQARIALAITGTRPRWRTASAIENSRRSTMLRPSSTLEDMSISGRRVCRPLEVERGRKADSGRKTTRFRHFSSVGVVCPRTARRSRSHQDDEVRLVRNDGEWAPSGGWS